MKRLVRYLLLLLLTTCMLAACDRQPQAERPQQSEQERVAPPPVVATEPDTTVKQPTGQVVAPFLSQPNELSIVELPTEALPIWRKFRQDHPVLVLLTDDPFLQPIPSQLAAAATELVNVASPAEIRRSTAPLSFNPVLLPSMTVSAALDAGYFSEVVWVVPTEQTLDQFDLALFTEQLVEFGAIEPDEAATFIRNDDSFAGTVHGLPFRVVLSSYLPQLSESIVLHIDLSYFGPLYKNEVTTPLFPTVLGQLTAIHQARWTVLATTLSLSNLSGAVPLDSRFLRTVFSEIFAEPALLAGEAPLNWQRQKDIFYVENLFQYEKGLDLALAMTQTAPADAGAHFALYKAYRLLRMSQEAFDSLDRAVALDPIYAREYLHLAPLASEKGNADESVRMLRLAATALPDQPLIRLDLTHALLQAGDQAEALNILDELIAADWSPVYFPDMKTVLREQRQAVEAAHAE